MPTGYTAGILDGKITDFSQFAKQCIRAFGAAFHMRDEPFDKEYEPQTTTSYHSDMLHEYKKQLQVIEAMSDNELVDARKKRAI